MWVSCVYPLIMPKDEDQQQDVEFGGSGSGREVFERWYGEMPNVQKTFNKKGKETSFKLLRDSDGPTENAKDWEAEKEWAMASGSWVGKANKYADDLYTNDNMDYNDQMRYAKMAGISDINSESDVSAIREAYNNAHTSEDELQSAMTALRDELTENVENGGDQTAAVNMTYNQYLENADAKSSADEDAAAMGAQSMLSDNVQAIAADKNAVGYSKANMGKYVLKNLKSDKYEGGN